MGTGAESYQRPCISCSPLPLADTTKKTELERLRAFLRYCKDRGWIKNDHSKKLTHKAKTEAKFGLLPDEEDRLFAAIDCYHIGIGRSTIEGTNALRGICYVMRHAGLRIIDATKLDDSRSWRLGCFRWP